MKINYRTKLNSRTFSFNNKNIYNLDPGFYLSQNLLYGYDCFEESGICQNRCIFCCNSEPGDLKNSPGSIKKNCSNNRRIMLCCGEPMDITDINRKIKKLRNDYPIVAMTTHGRRLKNKKTADALFKSGLKEIIFSLHAHKPEIHDNITGVKGSFEEAVEGMRNVIVIKKKKNNNFKIGVNFVILKGNINSLFMLVNFLNNLGIDTINFSTLIPMGRGRMIFKKEMPSYADILKAFQELKCRCIKKPELRKMKIFLTGVPWCITKSLNYFYPDYTFLLNTKSNEFINLNYKHSKNICLACSFNIFCEGIFEEYVKIYGLDEFHGI